MDKLILRVKEVTLKPNEAWVAIKAEETTVMSIIMKYLLFLAIIPGVAFYLRHLRETAAVALIGALLFFVLSIVGAYLGGKLIEMLAGQFSATTTEVDAFKLVAYSLTPALIGSVFLILPWLSGLMFIVALYSLYLVYTGFPVFLTCPDEKRLPFSIVSMVIVYAVFVAAYYIARVFAVIF